MVPGVISLPLLFNTIQEASASDKVWIRSSGDSDWLRALTQDPEETGVASPDDGSLAATFQNTSQS